MCGNSSLRTRSTSTPLFSQRRDVAVEQAGEGEDDVHRAAEDIDGDGQRARYAAAVDTGFEGRQVGERLAVDAVGDARGLQSGEEVARLGEAFLAVLDDRVADLSVVVARPQLLGEIVAVALIRPLVPGNGDLAVGVKVVAQRELRRQRVVIGRDVRAEQRQVRVAVAGRQVAEDLVVGAVLLEDEDDVPDRVGRPAAEVDGHRVAALHLARAGVAVDPAKVDRHHAVGRFDLLLTAARVVRGDAVDDRERPLHQAADVVGRIAEDDVVDVDRLGSVGADPVSLGIGDVERAAGAQSQSGGEPADRDEAGGREAPRRGVDVDDLDGIDPGVGDVDTRAVRAHGQGVRIEPLQALRQRRILEDVERHLGHRLHRRGVEHDEEIDVGGGHVEERAVGAELHGARVAASEDVAVVDAEAARDRRVAQQVRRRGIAQVDLGHRRTGVGVRVGNR